MQTEVDQEKKSDPALWCGRTSPEPSAPTKEQTSEQSCKKQSASSVKPPLFLCLTKDGRWQDASTVRGGIGPSRGEYSTHSFGESPSVDVESHLSQILEASPHPKYSLSVKACQGIIRRAERRGKPLPDLLRQALELQAQEAPRRVSYCIQGNCIDRADTAGCNGKGWTEGVSYTLNTVDRPAVCDPVAFDTYNMAVAGDRTVTLRAGAEHSYTPVFQPLSAVYDARGNGDGNIAPTMTGDHNGHISDYTAVLVGDRGGLKVAGFKSRAGSKSDIAYQPEQSPTLLAGCDDASVVIAAGYSQATYDKFVADNKSATLKALGGSYGGGQ